MNIFRPLKHIRVGRLLESLFHDIKEEGACLYLEPRRMYCTSYGSGEGRRILPPILLKEGSPIDSSFDFEKSVRECREALSRYGLGRHMKVDIVADIPCRIYAWKFEIPRPVSEVIDDLDNDAKSLISSAPDNYRWTVLNMDLTRPLSDGTINEAIIVGVPEELCSRILMWAESMDFTVQSICPLVLPTISSQLRDKRVFTYWSELSDVKYLVAIGNNAVESVEDISSLGMRLAEMVNELWEEDSEREFSHAVLGRSDALEEAIAAIPEEMRRLNVFCNGSIDKDGIAGMVPELRRFRNLCLSNDEILCSAANESNSLRWIFRVWALVMIVLAMLFGVCLLGESKVQSLSELESELKVSLREKTSLMKSLGGLERSAIKVMGWRKILNKTFNPNPMLMALSSALVPEVRIQKLEFVSSEFDPKPLEMDLPRPDGGYILSIEVVSKDENAVAEYSKRLVEFLNKAYGGFYSIAAGIPEKLGECAYGISLAMEGGIHE